MLLWRASFGMGCGLMGLLLVAPAMVKAWLGLLLVAMTSRLARIIVSMVKSWSREWGVHLAKVSYVRRIHEYP